MSKIISKSEKSNFKYEFLAPLILSGIILVFLSPMLFLIEGMNADDGAFQSFPKLMAIARSYQHHELPLWDHNEFAGGKPYYMMLENPAYNIFHFPFYFLANLDSIDQSYYVLYIIPFALMVIFAGLGAYFLGRVYFKFNFAISVLLGFLWAVNPSIGASYISSINTTVFACIPWIILTAAQFLETKKLGWWIGGVLSVVIMNCGYTINYPVRIYFMLAIIFMILSIWQFMKNRKNLTAIVFTLLIFITGILITSFVWAHILEAAKYSGEQFKLTYGMIVDSLQNNMPPAHLITLFIPNFNGSLDSVHSWGDGMLIISADRNLTGGVFTFFCIIIAVVLLINEKEWKIKINEKYRMWIMILLSLNILTLLVMMAKYTPVYFILCKILPWIFLIPFPFYFHFIHHLASVLLAILGIHLYIEHKKDILNKFNARMAIYYIGFIIVFIVVYLLSPVPSMKAQAYKFLGKFRQWEWFITNPILYFAAASVILLSVYSGRKRKPEVFKNTLIAAVFIESLFVGYICFYKNLIVPRPLEGIAYEKYERQRYKLPSMNPVYSQIGELKNLSENFDSRWVSDQTSADGMAWMINGESLGGYDGKPLISNLRLALRTFYSNFPYQLTSFTFPRHFLSNMNVGHLLEFDNLKEENRLYTYRKNDTDYYFTRSPEPLLAMKTDFINYYFENFKDPFFKIHTLDEPMPYLYFQDRIFKADAAAQKDNMIKEDLRKFAMLPDDTKIQYPLLKQATTDKFSTKKEFDSLQSSCRITGLDRKKNNTLKLTVETGRPLLLVRNETYHPDWKVFVDGKEEKLLQVNYLQQGLLLTAGHHDIVYDFYPEKFRKAVMISVLSLIIACAGVLIYLLMKNLIFRKKSKDQTN